MSGPSLLLYILLPVLIICVGIGLTGLMYLIETGMWYLERGDFRAVLISLALLTTLSLVIVKSAQYVGLQFLGFAGFLSFGSLTLMGFVCLGNEHNERQLLNRLKKVFIA